MPCCMDKALQWRELGVAHRESGPKKGFRDGSVHACTAPGAAGRGRLGSQRKPPLLQADVLEIGSCVPQRRHPTPRSTGRKNKSSAFYLQHAFCLKEVGTDRSENVLHCVWEC